MVFATLSLFEAIELVGHPGIHGVTSANQRHRYAARHALFDFDSGEK